MVPGQLKNKKKTMNCPKTDKENDPTDLNTICFFTITQI